MVNRPTEPNEIRFDLRRSQRVHAQLPVVVQGKLTDEIPFVDPTRAIVLSAHGCLITLSAFVRLDDTLILRNVATREEQDCRVVYLGEKQGGRTEVGLRFKTLNPVLVRMLQAAPHAIRPRFRPCGGWWTAKLETTESKCPVRGNDWFV